MKAKIEKDIRYRKKFLNLEAKSLPIKTILSTAKININLRQNLYFYSHFRLITDGRIKIHNRCILSGRSRSVIRFFNLSRIKFRELALKGHLVGVKKASW